MGRVALRLGKLAVSGEYCFVTPPIPPIAAHSGQIVSGIVGHNPSPILGPAVYRSGAFGARQSHLSSRGDLDANAGMISSVLSKRSCQRRAGHALRPARSVFCAGACRIASESVSRIVLCGEPQCGAAALFRGALPSVTLWWPPVTLWAAYGCVLAAQYVCAKAFRRV